MNYDEIGFWSEVKLEIIKKYAKAYSTIMNSKSKFEHYYIDGFSGAGKHLGKDNKEEIKGSPINALEIEPPFKHYYFIDLNSDKIDHLCKLIGPRKDVSLIKGDCNKKLIDDIFPKIQYNEYKRALCLLDPYGLHLDWEVIRLAGSLKTIEIFLNYPVLDMNRNVLLTNPDDANDNDIKRMDNFWGDNSWRDIAYSNEPDLFGGSTLKKEQARSIANAFRDRLKKIAGFKYVPEPIPMRNSQRGLLYYLFFASPNKTGDKIVEDIFDSYRKQGWN